MSMIAVIDAAGVFDTIVVHESDPVHVESVAVGDAVSAV